MMSVGVQNDDEPDIVEFYDFLYEAREGYVYAATKDRSAPPQAVWKQHFFMWPHEKAKLLEFTRSNRSRYDVYVAPSLFSDKKADKGNILGSNLVWAELDDPPKAADSLPEPTCRVASGGDGHEHWYWKVDRILNSDQLDIINQSLAYVLDADPSGWDSTQVLRPPRTYNHKRKRETNLLFQTDAVLSLSFFANLPRPPERATVDSPTHIPAVAQVVAKYKFKDEVIKLFHTQEPIDRSNALMALGYHCAEMGMDPNEILSIIMNADDRWLKFSGRHDRMQRLMEIVSIAITKYPKRASTLTQVDLKPMGFKTLLNTEVDLQWQWDGLLHENGYFLLTGPTGVGKTQFTLDMAGHMALGRPFLERKTKPAKIGFFSLEMGLLELKFFLDQLQYSFSPEDHDVLEEMLQFFPLGESLYFTDPEVQETVDQIVGDLKLDGVIIDSLGSATEDNVSDEKFKTFFHWNDRFRQRHNIFTWYIHHHRKANGDNRKPNKISDVYGSQYITSYATSVVCLWDTGVINHINMITLKNRLAPKDPPAILARDHNLHYVKARVVDNLTDNPLAGAGAGQMGSPVSGTSQPVTGQQGATDRVVRPAADRPVGDSNGWSSTPSWSDNGDADIVINFGDVK